MLHVNDQWQARPSRTVILNPFISSRWLGSENSVASAAAMLRDAGRLVMTLVCNR